MSIAEVSQSAVEQMKSLAEENARLKSDLTVTRRLLDSALGALQQESDTKFGEQRSLNWVLKADIAQGQHPEESPSGQADSRVVLWRAAELLDLINGSIVIRDLENRIIFWNAGAEARYGWSREEAVGCIFYQLLRTQFPRPLIEITKELFQSDLWEGKLVHFTRTGNQIVSTTRWALLGDLDGRHMAVLETDKDVFWRHMEEELQAKSDRLQEVNAALKTLLRQRDEDRREFEEALLTNIENLILPYLRRMKTGTLSTSQGSLLEIVESHLKEITSRFSKSLALEYRILTPTEMRVAALVREGKTSKEIADLLCISEKTASFHRNNIRMKLGLRGLGINLRSHLLSLT